MALWMRVAPRDTRIPNGSVVCSERAAYFGRTMGGTDRWAFYGAQSLATYSGVQRSFGLTLSSSGRLSGHQYFHTWPFFLRRFCTRDRLDPESSVSIIPRDFRGGGEGGVGWGGVRGKKEICTRDRLDRESNVLIIYGLQGWR